MKFYKLKKMPIDMIGAGVRKIEFCFNKWFGMVR